MPDFGEDVQTTVHRRGNDCLVTIFNYDETRDALVRVRVPNLPEGDYGVTACLAEAPTVCSRQKGGEVDCPNSWGTFSGHPYVPARPWRPHQFARFRVGDKTGRRWRLQKGYARHPSVAERSPQTNSPPP